MISIRNGLLLIIVLLFTSNSIASPALRLNNTEFYAKYPWAITYYHSWMTDNNISSIPAWDDIVLTYGTMDTLEGIHVLPRENWFRKIFKDYVGSVEVAGNITHRNDPVGSIWEFEPYLILRWNNFQWNRYLFTTFAFGDGLSYATNIPLRELNDLKASSPSHLLNFLLFEMTFAPPPNYNVELVARIHHRCGAWGFFGAGNLSSNAVSLGIRYRF